MKATNQEEIKQKRRKNIRNTKAINTNINLILDQIVDLGQGQNQGHKRLVWQDGIYLLIPVQIRRWMQSKDFYKPCEIDKSY